MTCPKLSAASMLPAAFALLWGLCGSVPVSAADEGASTDTIEAILACHAKAKTDDQKGRALSANSNSSRPNTRMRSSA